MLTYLIGPLFAIFPKRWRESLPFCGYIRWARATAISGIAEFAGGLTALSYWYTRAMTTWVGRGVDAALNKKAYTVIRPQDIGGVALIVWASHPLTLLLAYVCFEGTLRAGAAFTENGLGTLPFFLIDKAFSLIFGTHGPKRVSEIGNSGNSPASMRGAIRERMAMARPAMADELCVKKKGAEEILEICASRRKEGWDPPRTVRYRDVYYRLEAVFTGSGPRPFQYVLRRLPAGVPGRTVLLYSPADVVVRQER